MPNIFRDVVVLFFEERDEGGINLDGTAAVQGMQQAQHLVTGPERHRVLNEILWMLLLFQLHLFCLVFTAEIRQGERRTVRNLGMIISNVVVLKDRHPRDVSKNDHNYSICLCGNTVFRSPASSSPSTRIKNARAPFNKT